MSSSSPIETGQPSLSRKGSLKVFLGYAAGVGKTYQMLEEAQELKRQGVDVVVGYFEPHARPDTIAKLEGLEVIARRPMEYRGTRFEEMDSEAVLLRRPQVCVVDEFPHTNVPGSSRAKRWEDVLIFLSGGIDVLTTMNVQHLESLNDQIYEITGVRVRETVPDWVVQQAAEVVMIDLTPRALLNRLQRGVVYQGEKALKARENFFKESTLVALRELALRETAFEVECRHAPAGNGGPSLEDAGTEAESSLPLLDRGRVLVYITPEPSTAALIRRCKRVADYLHVECLALAISAERDLTCIRAERRDALEKQLAFARSLQIATHLLSGQNIAQELVSFARQNGVTQLYLGRPPVPRWGLPFTHDLVEQVTRLARDMEVTIVAERSPKRAAKP